MKKLFLIVVFLLLTGSAFPSEIPVRITAEKLSGNVNVKVTAEGNVVITYEDVVVIGDSAFYDRENGILKVSGNVVIKEGEVELHCQNLIYDLNTKRAVLEKVSGRVSPTDYIKADRVERISEKEWIAYDGVYTPCSHTCPDWSVKAKEFKVLLGESFKSKWASFRVKEIPIIVTPYLSGPIVKKRTSGFLFPKVGYRSDDGFIYKQPFYIVLGRSADLTLTYEKRFRNGNSKSGELRYVLSEKNRGNLYYYVINRKEGQDWKFTFSHDFNPSDFFYGRGNVELINSRRYFKSTDSFDIEEKTQVYTKSDITVSRLWKHAILNINAVYLNYLDGSTDRVYQKFPTVNFYLLDIPVWNTPFTFSTDSELTYFYRKAGGSSYRLNVKPAVRFSQSFGAVKNTAKWAFLLTEYQHGGNRSIFQFTDVITTTSHYSLSDNLSLSLNPEFQFHFTENENQSDNPFYDNSDRIEKEKSIIPGLTAYLYRSGERLGRVSISGLYNFYNDEDPWGLWKVDLDTNPVSWLMLKETVYYSPHDAEVKKTNSYISANLMRVSLWLNHYYDFDEEISANYLRWGFSLPINRIFSFSYQQRYDLKLTEDREWEYGFSANRGCWNGRLSYRWVKNYDNTIDYQILLTINLLKLGNYGYKFAGRKE